MSKMHIDFPIKISAAEAKERLQALGDYLWNKHKIGVTWNGDQANIKGKYLVVGIEGTVAVREGMVTFDGKDPGLLWRNKAREYLAYKLGSYLDPSTPFENLPRA